MFVVGRLKELIKYKGLQVGDGNWGHYANTPMQYTAIFHGCKNDNFQMKSFIFFLIFTQNIDCGYTYPKSIFWSENKKKVYPCKPQFYYIKVGCKGVFVTRTCFHDVQNSKGYTPFPMACCIPSNFVRRMAYRVKLKWRTKYYLSGKEVCC